MTDSTLFRPLELLGRLTLTLGLLVGSLAAPSAIAEEPPAEPYRNTVKWATASETDNFGYDVYRSDSEEGPFERLNDEPIAGAGTTDETTRYEFVDDTIDPHQAYYYFVEAISMDGSRERFTPIIRAPAKLAESDEDETAPEGGEAPSGDEGED